ncbi:hypothetical protein GN244_ATG12797 [Phytophthora infestans]|uniref:Uncharacterized protein n=1 Tax=Phytophthora infestans TaxID=4787 RepID=A0A833WS01_PHYIN|nr:hypothetical protein GN244_ATG12797 [Phytophthora infestans]KAF4129784.1 hypothetical protein GN958_ATG21019 [Phytophthora infestans]
MVSNFVFLDDDFPYDSAALECSPLSILLPFCRLATNFMIKLIIFAATAALTTRCGYSIATDDRCVPIDFTAEGTKFSDLNAGIKTMQVDKLLGSVIGNYDPFVQSKIPLRFTLNAMLTISTAIDSLNITGLTSFAPQYINLTSPNSVSIEAASSGEVIVDTELNAMVEAMNMPATARLQLC